MLVLPMTTLHRRNFFAAVTSLAVAPLAAAGRDPVLRLRLGAQTNTWGAPIKSYGELLHVLDALHWLGYSGFETNYKSLESQAARAADCRRAFASRAIRYIAPHIGARLYDHEGAGKEIEDLAAIAGYSAEMGASHFIVSGSRIPREDGDLLQKIRIKIETLNRLGRRLRRTGLKLCYHNHSQEFEGDPMEIEVLLRGLDPELVWLNYDVGNHYGYGPDAARFSAGHFRRIAIYHLKDVAPGETRAMGTDFGAGKIDLKGVIRPVLESDWEGWLVVEREGSYPHPAEDPEARQAQCREYLRQIVGF
jgi:sugar phosphate isomerase/epimerase